MSESPEALLGSVDLVDFGRRLKSQRIARGLTQEAVAGDDISAAYVSRIEAGQRRPEPPVARLLAERLGTTVEHLVTGVEPRRAEEARLALRYAELALNSGEATDAELQVRLLLADSGARLGPMRREAQWVHARCLEAIGRLDEAATLLEEVVADRQHQWWLPAAISLCRCYREAGDLSRSIEVGQDALHHAESLGLDGTEDAVRLAVSLVGAYYERGDELYAVQLSRATIARADRLQSAIGRASAYWNASIIASSRGEVDEAVRLAERALTLMSDTDDVRSLARLRQQLGTLLLGQRPPDTAQVERLARQARKDLAGTDGGVVDMARCDVLLAQAQLIAGELDAAEQAATAALAALAGHGPFVAAEAEAVLGQIESQRSERTKARSHYRAAVASLTAAGADRSAAELWADLGALLDEAGDTQGARDAYRSAAASMGVRSTNRVALPALQPSDRVKG